MLTIVLSGTHTALSPARHSLPVLIHILSLHGELSTHISPFSAAITIPLSSVNSRFSAISSRDSVKTVTPSDVTTAVSDVFALVYLYAVSTAITITVIIISAAPCFPKSFLSISDKRVIAVCYF